jgi:hypothetical protein
MRLLNFGKSVLIASIPGAVLPIAFFLLFSFNTTATRRDVLPSLNNPLEVVGCFGFLSFSIPILITIFGLVIIVNAAHDRGFVVPYLDSLAPEQQLGLAITIGLISNVVLWTMLVSYWRQHKREVAMQADLVIGENQN